MREPEIPHAQEVQRQKGRVGSKLFCAGDEARCLGPQKVIAERAHSQ